MAQDLDPSSAADKRQRKIPPDYSVKPTMTSLSPKWQQTAKLTWIIACILLSASNISKLQSNPVLRQNVTIQVFASEDFYHTNATDDTSKLHCIMPVLALNHPRCHGDNNPAIPFPEIGICPRKQLLPPWYRAPPLYITTAAQVSVDMSPMMGNPVDVTTLLSDYIPTKPPMIKMVRSGLDNVWYTTIISVLPLFHAQYFSVLDHQFPVLYGRNIRFRHDIAAAAAAADIFLSSAADNTYDYTATEVATKNITYILPLHQYNQYYKILYQQLLFLFGNEAAADICNSSGGDNTSNQTLSVNVPTKVDILKPMSVLYSIMDNERESLCHFTTDANIWEHRPPEFNNCID